MPVIFLMGPTASGKTDLAMRLCDQLPCDIVSVDSAMIYRGMDIGTAKPDRQTLQHYPHRLIDIRDPAESYSAAEFRQDVLSEIARIRQQGRIPLLTGGTMLYFHALQNGLAELPESDPEIRERLLQWGLAEGWSALHARLSEVDPESAARLNPNDSQRLQRALEVYELTGRPITELWREQASQRPVFPILSMAVMPQERAVLHERIALRFELMIRQGFVEEVQALWARGDLDVQMPSVRCVGYRQVWNYLSGDWDHATMVEKGIIATRQLAKRQVTWLRSWPELHWLDSLSDNLLAKALKKIEAGII